MYDLLEKFKCAKIKRYKIYVLDMAESEMLRNKYLGGK